jgi:hypothetical protein
MGDDVNGVLSNRLWKWSGGSGWPPARPARQEYYSLLTDAAITAKTAMNRRGTPHRVGRGRLIFGSSAAHQTCNSRDSSN